MSWCSFYAFFFCLLNKFQGNFVFVNEERQEAENWRGKVDGQINACGRGKSEWWVTRRRWEEEERREGGRESLTVFVLQCHLDYGSQEDGNQARYLLPQVGAAALHLHLLGERHKQKCTFWLHIKFSYLLRCIGFCFCSYANVPSKGLLLCCFF